MMPGSIINKFLEKFQLDQFLSNEEQYKVCGNLKRQFDRFEPSPQVVDKLKMQKKNERDKRQKIEKRERERETTRNLKTTNKTQFHLILEREQNKTVPATKNI